MQHPFKRRGWRKGRGQGSGFKGLPEGRTHMTMMMMMLMMMMTYIYKYILYTYIYIYIYIYRFQRHSLHVGGTAQSAKRLTRNGRFVKLCQHGVCKSIANSNLHWKIIIIMHRLPLGRFPAPTSSTSPCPQPSSSFPHTHHSFSFLSSLFPLTHFPRSFPYKTPLLDHLSSPFLVCPSASSPPLSRYFT